MVQWMRQRKPLYKYKNSLFEIERPSVSYISDVRGPPSYLEAPANTIKMLPPLGRPTKPADSIPVKHLHSSLNKAKFPINVVLWTHEGRRLLTASSSGEFTLWNGMGFNFETIMQAHDAAVRAACFSHGGEWLISADQDGYVKYFQQNFNNVKVFQAHSDGIRGLAFAPTDAKFVTGADDATLKVFDFAAGVEDLELKGHQWEVRCVDWHPRKGLLVSGSKDHSVKLWDPRNGRCLTTLSSSKNIVSRAIFEPSEGTYLATSGRDSIIRIFDMRMMREVYHLRGHENDVTSLVWHPIHKNLISSGGHGGAMHHYILDEQNPPSTMSATLAPYDCPRPENAAVQTIFPAHSIPYAHEPTGPIWSLAWHPLGHILASGSNDRITRFWTRARPGDNTCFNDRYHIGQAAAEAQGTYDRRGDRRQMREEEEQEAQDEAEGLLDQQMPSKASGLPGLPGLGDGANGAPALPGIGAAPAPAPAPLPAGPPGLPPIFAGMDPSKIDLAKLAEMFNGQLPPMPPPGMPPPGMPPPHVGLPLGAPPPPFPGGSLPSGFPPPPIPGMPFAGLPGQGPLPLPLPPPAALDISSTDGGSNARRRAPLPSQQESLREELRRGRRR